MQMQHSAHFRVREGTFWLCSAQKPQPYLIEFNFVSGGIQINHMRPVPLQNQIPHREENWGCFFGARIKTINRWDLMIFYISSAELYGVVASTDILSTLLSIVHILCIDKSLRWIPNGGRFDMQNMLPMVLHQCWCCVPMIDQVFIGRSIFR